MNTSTATTPTSRYLLIVEDPTARRMITLEGAKYSLGRQEGNSIVLNSRKASRKHATLVKKHDSKNNRFSYWIVDGDLDGNKSHNGIFVNGEKCLVHELKDGDLINFGCEVNASYHIINSVTEAETSTPIIESPPPQEEADSWEDYELNIHQKSTLILSESHIDDSDIPKEKVDEDTFHDYTYLDNLTGLPNQVLFNEYLSIAIANARRNGTNLALFMVNIEQFNEINETYGYVIGDRVLQNVGETLNDCVRSSDIVARWQGNTFAILLPQIKDINNSHHIEKRLVNKIRKPVQVDKFSVALSSHIATVIYPQDGQDLHTLIRRLEQKLQDNKKTVMAQNKTAIQSPETVTAYRLSRIETRLQNALERQEFSLLYQPQVNLRTGLVEVMEALLRWHHPQRGLVHPPKFFPWLEKTSIMLPITQWILEMACQQNKTWQDLDLACVPVSVNLSLEQLQHPDFLKSLTNILEKTDLDPQWLELEITEKTALKNLDYTRDILYQLKALGISISLDDFGKGLVSLGYLRDLPFQKIKIDPSFIQNLTHYPEETGMISALIALGKSFDLKVVAEGVETQQQLEILRNLQCDIMQGYRFAPPLDLEHASQFLVLHGVRCS